MPQPLSRWTAASPLGHGKGRGLHSGVLSVFSLLRQVRCRRCTAPSLSFCCCDTNHRCGGLQQRAPVISGLPGVRSPGSAGLGALLLVSGAVRALAGRGLVWRPSGGWQNVSLLSAPGGHPGVPAPRPSVGLPAAACSRSDLREDLHLSERGCPLNRAGLEQSPFGSVQHQPVLGP